MDRAVSAQSSGRAALALIAVLVGAACILLLVDGLPLHGTLLAFAVLGPYGLYLALVRPIVFPFALYVVLVPFDNLLVTGSYGTLTKLLGIVTGVFLLLWIARRGTKVVPHGSIFILAGLLLWMLASAFWALDQSASLQILPTYAGLMLLYAALAMTPVSMRDVRIILACVVAGGLAAAAYGANYFYHHPVLADNADTKRLVIHIGASSIDPNHFANSLLVPAMVLAVWALRTPRLYAKVLGIAGLGLIFQAILLSGSREALLALGAGAVYLLVRSRYRLQILLAAAAAFAAAQSAQTSMWERFSSAILTGGSGRTSIWRVAADAVVHRPLLGYGVGNFPAAYDQYYLRVYQSYTNGWSSAAHNIVFHYTVELGVVGIALIAWFFWKEFRSLRIVDARSDLYDYRVMLEAGLLTIAIVSMSIDLFTYKYAWLAFFLIALFRNAATAPGENYSEATRAATPSIMAARPSRS